LVLASPALAEEDTSTLGEAQEDIKESADEIGTKAGVKSEVLDGGSYGSAGCGLGSLIFEPSNDFVQIFAATTNGLFGTQTFGITSGTSNCDGSAGAARNVESFIVANRSALAVEVARGRGETISSLSAIAACNNDVALARTLQSNFKTIFPNAIVTDRQVSVAMVGLMRNHAALACTSLS
jgi:hypothetical protein